MQHHLVRFTLLLLAVACLPAHAYDEMFMKGAARGCYFAYYPSDSAVWVKLDFTRKNVRRTEVADLGKQLTSVEVAVTPQGSDKVLASARVPVKDGRSAETRLAVPKLEGDYEVRFTLPAGDKPVVLVKPLQRLKFPWEGNKLGITDEVFPPFEPIKAAGSKVNVVLRQYTMNGFGLWDSVVSEGQELLAGPMAIRYETAAGEGAWGQKSVKLGKNVPNLATYSAEAAADPVRVKAACSVEMDGCMKVEMSLLPGAKPAEIKRLWLDIPLKRSQASLLHEMADGIRINYSGDVPPGEGVVWDSTKAPRGSQLWRNSFVSYVWLGGEERGVAWFAENDRGWLTEKGGSKLPLQEILREGDTVTLRVYLINHPATVTAQRDLVFGLQASPTKPMPKDWRAQSRYIPGGSGPVNPWGGLYCAYKGPYKGHWEVVDKIIEGQRTGKPQEEWFKAFAAQYNPPPIYGTWPWLTAVMHFSTMRQRPVMTYQEEMAAPATEPPWITFQDEWSCTNYTPRQWPDEDMLRKGFNFSPGAGGAFPASYRDYGAYYANEWLKRGVGPYWDNTYPKFTTNLRNSAAYVAEDGEVQPAIQLWNQREYHKRVWNLFSYWRTHQAEPLEWSNHMTNSLILPLQTWGTVCLDNEFNSTEPLLPDRDRAETLGRQVGCYSYSLYPLYGTENPAVKALTDAQRERINWGMKMVHEMLRGGYTGGDSAVRDEKQPPSLEWRVYDFGYGSDKVQVHNYWAQPAALSVNSPQVTWIVLARPEDKTALVVVNSWASAGVAANLKLNADALGFAPGAKAVDEETGEALPVEKAGTWTVDLPGPYGVRMIRVTP